MARAPASENGLKMRQTFPGFVNRSPLEEGMVVLEAIRNGADDKTMLLSETYLPWSKLRGLLGFLAEAGLLRVEEGGSKKTFKLRARGLELVRRYKSIVQRVETARIVI